MVDILIVDDDTDLLMIMKLSLTQYGFRATTLGDPSRVEETILAAKPAIVILDINMGEWNGLEICRQLKESEIHRHLPVVLYSALANASVALEACKADLFLQKPLTAQELARHLTSLNTVMGNSHAY